ncbi:MAG: transcriptional regulator [Spirosoma sp.]|nr:transcriptional regulator [Spirosoma sp.]
MVKLLYLLVLLGIPLMPGFAQSSPSPGGPEKKSQPSLIANQFEHLSVKDGLSNNSVTDILQDSEGFLWFGTPDGLNKYDGYTFTVLQQDPNKPDSSLRSNSITAIYEDHSGKLWVTTERGIIAGGGGLHQVDKKTGTATPVPMKVPSEEWKQTRGICEDHERIFWIGSWAGLIRYNPQTGEYKGYPSPKKKLSILCVIEDTQNQIWVGTPNGLYQFNRRSGQFALVPLQSVPADQQPRVITLHEDKMGNLWVGTGHDGLLRINTKDRTARLVPYVARQPVNQHLLRNAIYDSQDGHLWLGTTQGLQQIDTRTGEVVTYRGNPGLQSGLNSDRIQAIYRDGAGTLWVGTDQGINKQVGLSPLFTSIQLVPAPASSPAPENSISALFQDHTGIIWIGCANKKLYKYDPQTGQTTFVPIDPENPDNPAEAYRVETVYEDRSRRLWVSTRSALLQMNRLTGTFIRYPARITHIQTFDEDASGLLWLGGINGAARFNPKNGQFRYYFSTIKDTTDGRGFVEHVMISRTGDIWMAIKKIGISRLHPQTGKFTSYHPTLPAPAGQLNDQEVTALYEDSTGVVWIGTNQGGLNWYDPATGRVSALTTRDGLPANHVAGIINDRHGHLWISTSRGICRFNTRTKTFHNYTTNDGLPHNWFRRKVSYGLYDDLLFGNLNGVVIVHPDRIYNKATSSFPVYITKFSVLDRNRPLTTDPIELQHDENFISFDFVALTYQSSEKNQYAHQLVGVDKNWVYSGTRHFAAYSTLSPGTYTFRVKAANGDGIWNEKGHSVTVIIHPPWWASWWAYGLYTLLAGGAIWGLTQAYTNRIRQRQESELNRREAQQLKTVDELKTRFFTNITHEFRTPLSLIIAPVEKLLQQNQFDRPLLTTVHRNAEQLLRLINQLLDLSKLEGHYMTVSLRQGELTDFIDHLIDVFGRAAEQKGITLSLVVDDLPKQTYLFDADKWEKILTNLLSNALKFTPAGGQITLTATPVWTGVELAAVQFQVADSGVGIAPDKLPHIFDRFYQADTSSTRAYEGTGIGLALVKELIDLLGGTIRVESQPNVGTTIDLTLPVQPVSKTEDIPKVSWTMPSQPAVASLSLPAQTSVNEHLDEEHLLPLILIVEDNEELREFLVAELSSAYHVLQAEDGEAGWAQVQNELPDIVLTDVMMPRMDGHELTRLIKGHAHTDHIAVVMLTAKSAQPSRIDGLLQGADDYLSKPFNVEELQLRFHNLIRRQQRLGDHYRQQFALPRQSRIGIPAGAMDSPNQSSSDLPAVVGHSGAEDSQNSKSQLPKNQDLFLTKIYALLDEQLDNPSISVDWLADQLAMNRKTLYRKVHSLIQLAPADLIRQYRLRKAAELLQAGHNVSETADLVGFSSASHFTMVFKEFYHETPSEFLSSRFKSA